MRANFAERNWKRRTCRETALSSALSAVRSTGKSQWTEPEQKQKSGKARGKHLLHFFGDDEMFAVIHRSSGLVLKACRSGKAMFTAAGPQKGKAGITKFLQYAAVVLDDGGFSEVSV